MEQPYSSELFSLSIDPMTKSYLSETAKWARFLAIVGFIITGLIVLAGIFFSTFFGYLMRSTGNDLGGSLGAMGGAMTAVASTFYILIALFYFFPCLFLFRFANRMRTALASNSQQDLNTSFQNLKSLFKFVGILTVVFLAIYALAIIFGIIGASLSR